ncbi:MULTISPECIES: acyltransferase family protein [unclassified Bradyrhizobium]|uniref:acyltransferase family protein n=1 Tax=unclassified Bradyrhizobium TaxID=2631580 RepID=UPI001FF99D49|nr:MULTISPECIES: acyltransferase family protein [unclassified Bradyrhizobium]
MGGLILKYRADIDGLRAIAVLSVLAFHYNAALPGGFTGVDVFFVISGFLITQQLSAEISNGTFSILNFYDRRIRRIVPALAVVLAFSLWIGKFLLLPGDYKSMAASAAYAALGASNFFFLSNTGYFDQASDLMPLLHTWSLGVEEQFYLAWPLLLALLATGRKRIDLAAAIGAAVVILFGASLFWLDTDPKGAFYLVLPRAWELALGALLVFLPPLPQRIGTTAIAAGLALIAAGFVLVHASSFPGASALYPCAGAALVIWPRETESKLGFWLGKLRPIGLISYSLYLWHWPVWVLFRHYINNAEPNWLEAIALVVVSIALASVSFRFIEKPFRKLKWNPAQTVRVGGFAAILLFCSGMYVHSSEGLPERMSPAIYPMRSLDAMWGWDCPKHEQLPQLKGQYCSFGHDWATAKTKALLWGDSHAVHLAPVVQAVARPNEGLLLYTNCPASFGGRVQRLDFEGFPNFAEYCTDQRKRAIQLLRDDPSINLVILASSWSRMSHQIIGDANLSPEKRISLVASGIEDLINENSIPGRRFLLVGSIPQLNKDPVPCAVNSLSGLLRRRCKLDATTVAFMKTYTVQTDRMLEAIAQQHANVTALIPRETMCDSVSCKTYINDEFIYRDASHIRRNLEPETLHELAGLIGLPAALNNQISSASPD